MPCRSDNDECVSDSERKCYERRITKIKKELDQVTQLLCYVCGTMQDPDSTNHPNFCETGVLAPPEQLVSWFNKHHAADEVRVSLAMAEEIKKLASDGKLIVAAGIANKFINNAAAEHPVSP